MLDIKVVLHAENLLKTEKASMTNKMRHGVQLMIIFIISKLPEMPITNSQSLRGPP